MTAAVDSLFDEYYGRYAERDMEGVTNLCLWPFVAIGCGEAIHLPTRDAVCDPNSRRQSSIERFDGAGTGCKVENPHESCPRTMRPKP
jgi:hypothetical protein